MSKFFPDITYSDICQTIANIISNDTWNVGSTYNNIPIYMKPGYGTNTDGSVIDVSSIAKNASMFWQARYSINNLYAIRIPSNLSSENVSTIKNELIAYLEGYFGIKSSNKISPGSFLELIYVLVWFLAWKHVIHCSQQQFPQYATGTDTSVNQIVFSCYDNLVSNLSYIKKHTGWDSESRIEKLNEISSKLIKSIDFERIISSLVEAFRIWYKFSGTYYDFNLLGGMPGSSIVFNITAYTTDGVTKLSGVDNNQFNNNLIKHTSIEYKGGDATHNIALTAPSTTQNYYFHHWWSSSMGDVINTYIDIPISVLFNDSGNPLDSNWYINAYYQEKENNTLKVNITSTSDFTYNSSDNTVTANIIGKSSLAYNGCKVTVGNNKNFVVYTGSGDSGFSINNNGVVTCNNKGTYVVNINQATTNTIKSYLSSYTIVVINEKLKLTTSMFTFTAPSSPEYGDASKNTATFELKSGYTGVSPFRTVQYAKLQSPMSWSNNAPTLDGTYVCRLIVDSGSVYDATGSDGLYDYDNWKFVVPAKTT